jgi:YfiH family protein
VVGAAHAGWRGLLAGVLENTVRAMNRPSQQLMAWMGPAIGPRAFEVGSEVREAFVARDPTAEQAFTAGAPGKYFADIYLLARQRLQQQGISRIYGGEYCTVDDPARFYSFRRDGVTGRMASLIWLQD